MDSPEGKNVSTDTETAGNRMDATIASIKSANEKSIEETPSIEAEGKPIGKSPSSELQGKVIEESPSTSSENEKAVPGAQGQMDRSNT